ncbi:seminase isoform X1 [Drosophila mauritiana]|uniref:Seminase isoform X1 n=1 Tax=Drosophila mauritiana TaxID=7226 RepID=A0A6P8K976_DROMA|nr:seminase isoform X1 [Drosophila mauritiana]
MQGLLLYCLLAATLASIEVLAQDLNQTIDVNKLAKIVQRPGFQTRVVGGEVTTNAQLGGYLIALRYEMNFVCGGTLLHDLIVLTAAHCFLGRVKISDWLAVGGASKLNDRGIQRHVKEVIKSAEFREDDMNMDVAILRLKKPMKGKSLGQLVLCKEQLKPGTELRVSGWGLTDNSEFGPQKLLRTVTVPVVDKKMCRASYLPTDWESHKHFDLFVKVHLTDSMFCAGVLGKKDACTFDSGGPLVYKNQVCGIVSFGIGCASKRYYGVYTDIMYVKPFIEQSIKVLLAKR